jgi:hypothetical protein
MAKLTNIHTSGLPVAPLDLEKHRESIIATAFATGGNSLPGGEVSFDKFSARMTCVQMLCSAYGLTRKEAKKAVEKNFEALWAAK